MKYTYTFDQLRHVDENAHLMYLHYESAVTNFGPIDQSRYFTADYGTIEADSEESACEKLWRKYNFDKLPDEYDGRGMSVSDIVNLWNEETDPPVKTSWFCDSYCWVKLERLEDQK